MKSSYIIKILSRKSDLAVIQAREVGDRIKQHYPNIEIQYITKKTSGDIDLKTPLSEMSSSGVFTDDLRNDLMLNKCDLAVHSWKDLPLNLGAETILAGSLKRADQRDILLIKKNQINKIIKKKSLNILSSSPRRIYNLKSFVVDYLPLKVEKVSFENVRGNIPLRFKKFFEKKSDGLILAKAAIDRLLINDINELKEISNLIRGYLTKCYWVITPLSQNPTSPGQGALGIEVKKNNKALIEIIKKISHQETIKCVDFERSILKKYGGGCHQKIGASYIPTHFGYINSQKGETENGEKFYSWDIHSKDNKLTKKTDIKNIYPSNLSDHKLFNRSYLNKSSKLVSELENKCIWISRTSALPEDVKINPTNVIWASGIKTWRSLAKKGIWVNGTSDGMGENFDTNINSLTKNKWIKLTHKSAHESRIKEVIYTYELKKLPFNEDISKKKYYYWMSSSAFKYILSMYPEIINAHHACGPGNTFEELQKIIKDPKRLEIVLTYNSWKNKLL